jgi:hypothetical protein
MSVRRSVIFLLLHGAGLLLPTGAEPPTCDDHVTMRAPVRSGVRR